MVTYAELISTELTRKEREVVTLAAFGYSVIRTAKIMRCSVETVKTHRRNIYRKLRANQITHAVAISMREQLIW